MIVTSGLTFGSAIEGARSGHRIRRQGWPEGVFVFAQVPSEVPLEIVPKMSSLPAGVKAEVLRRKRSLVYSNQLAIVDACNSVKGWAPSPTESLCGDWQVVEEEEAADFTAAPVAETA